MSEKKFLSLTADYQPTFVPRQSYDENALTEDEQEKLEELRLKHSGDQKQRSFSSSSASDLAPNVYMMDGLRPRAESTSKEA
ncbi:hypothetical protein TRVA0_010S00408 [Trichomonascus vanleenenianus]|uniref:uncharacterized protein n=1 Tax=Trichomonascus vanleenenianus TaxID=2268995 RepID=UPI003ECB7DF3